MSSVARERGPVNDSGGHDGDSALEDQIFEFVQKHEPVTYPELIRFCERIGVVGRGEWVQFAGDPCFVFWSGLSDQLHNAIVRLVESSRLFKHPSSMLHYIIAGEVLSFPKAQCRRCLALLVPGNGR